MPSRIIREGLLTSEPINLLSEGSELFYRRLMSVADDYGRYYSHPSLLRAACYPLKLESVSEKQVSKWLAECVENKVLMVYGDGKYIFIPKFGQQTRGRSKFPEPTEADLLIKCVADSKQPLTDSDRGPTTTTHTTTNVQPPVGDLPDHLKTPRMVGKWMAWQQYRRGFKKPPNWAVLFNQQVEWLSALTEPEAFESLSQSMRNGWQGLFVPKEQHANRSTSNKPRTDGNQGTRNEGRSNQYDLKSAG